ncbi:type II secretion system protein GspJ [Solemya pervernicosa gill symbiont]|uniref:Type II secretion system protein J n=2 Tax=Gammaproteobacteria incertae sedis TaxID=118884 RepID=A0A1T2L242_9GAMM|nr:type II secretion system minor pseudopilin GspJ [Candidatus Reidiella endopervernicosa]OOZ39167.1 type II secretion system protein GspJ [Solemya pervernicosa gill symbiont]QKQ28003.1 type II secretion system minor pseudopilin GspJ [Candidatus Reidiella endopervernicosa]
MKRQHGFTLLELMVAIAIFATLSVLAYGGLASVLESHEHTERQADRLQQLQKLFRYLERDIEQAVERPVRGAYGDSLPALQIYSSDGALLELTRSGRRNPANLPRSALQRVAYSFDEQRLRRHHWRVLDRAPDSEAVEIELSDGIEQISLRVMDDKREWQQSWPPTQIGAATTPRPLAIEVIIETEDYGRISRLFRVGG